MVLKSRERGENTDRKRAVGVAVNIRKIPIDEGDDAFLELRSVIHDVVNMLGDSDAGASDRSDSGVRYEERRSVPFGILQTISGIR